MSGRQIPEKNRSALIAVATAVVVAAFLVFPTVASGDDLGDSRVKSLDIEQRMQNLRIQMKEWDRKEAEHQKEADLSEDYLNQKTRDLNYFKRVLDEVNERIALAEAQLKSRESGQTGVQRVLRERVRAMALCAAATPEASTMRPSSRTALSLVRSRCRQLAYRSRVGNEERSVSRKEMTAFYEEQARYEAFVERARKQDSEVRDRLTQFLANKKAVEDLQVEGSQKMKELEAEQRRMGALIAALRIKSGEKPEKPVKPKPGAATDADAAIATSAHILTASPGASVFAAESGLVWFVNELEGWGNLVIIRHDDDKATAYGYLGQFTVGPNLNVFKGQEIGFVGPVKGSADFGVRFQVLDLSDGQKAIEPADWEPTSGDLEELVLGQPL